MLYDLKTTQTDKKINMRQYKHCLRNIKYMYIFWHKIIIFLFVPCRPVVRLGYVDPRLITSASSLDAGQPDRGTVTVTPEETGSFKMCLQLVNAEYVTNNKNPNIIIK